MRAFVNLTKALADATRLRLLLGLRRQELCVCQLTQLLGLAPSTVSRHLSILYQAGLVDARKAGRWMFYSLPGKEAPAAARAAIDWVNSSLRDDPRIAEDARRLKQVLKTDKAVLCKRQCRR